MSAFSNDVDDAAHLAEQVALECGAEVNRTPLRGKQISFAPDQLLDFAARCQVRLGAEREIQAIKAERDELLAALILMVRTHDEPAESSLQEMKELQWLERSRAAIAKATGSVK